MDVINQAWCLPRPRRNNLVPGCYPAYFERRLIKLLAAPEMILQPFGGLAEYGLRLDIRRAVIPDVLANAEQLPFKDDVFDMVLLDPPYSDDDAETLYGTGHVRIMVAASEAVRVVHEGGWVVLYHELALPVPPHTILTHRILVENRPWHTARIVHVHMKNTDAYHGRGTNLGKASCAACGIVYWQRSAGVL